MPLLVCTFTLLLAGGAHGQLTTRTLELPEGTRTWYEHMPAGADPGRPLPLVIALHGYSDSGDKFAALSEWEAVSDAYGVLVAFPNGGLTVGKDFGWNNFVFNGSMPDDVGFLAALIKQLQIDHRVDPDRIFMTGFSNGSGMTNNFAGIHSDVLAGIAPVSGGWLTGFNIPESQMHPAGPLPVWVWGNEYDNFENGDETLDVEEQKQLLYWRQFDGDYPTPNVSTVGMEVTSLYPGGKAETRFTEVLQGDHAYHPGTSARLWTEFFVYLTRQTRYTPPANFQDWGRRYFSADEMNDPAISGDAADPDGDGVPNLLEYALGSDPQTPDAGKGTVAGTAEFDGTQYLTLRFRPQPLCTDLDYTSESSGDMQNWAPDGVRADDAQGAMFRDDQPAGAVPRYLRLRVTRH